MVQGKSPLFCYLISFSFWVFLMHLHKSVDAAALYQECTVDADCSDANFCDPSYFVCETCVPCESLLNRASGAQSCATTENDCGLCLTGYQSEDLTEQRRSYKCFSIPNKQMEVPSTFSLLISWNEFITLSAAVIFLASVLVAFATYYMKGRLQREPYRDEIRERVSLKDSNPPPYSGEVLSSDVTYIYSTPVLSDQLNQATPLGHYHTSNKKNDLDPDDLVFDREILSEGDSTMGSTETIPSLWEPFLLMPNSEEMPVIRQQNHCLIRSQSSITVNVLRDSQSRSCPNLSTVIHAGIHRHRHIFLSNFRCSATNEQVAEKENEYRFEFSEPLPPHSFTFDEAEQPREVSIVSQGRILLRSISSPDDNVGSQDPGYAIPLFASFSRRRPFVNEDTISNKRRRRE